MRRSIRLAPRCEVGRPALPARRRLRPLPRPGRPRRRARVARAARRHRARPGRRERRRPAPGSRRDPPRRPPRGGRRRGLGLAPRASWRRRCPMRAARSRSSTAASTSSAFDPSPRPRARRRSSASARSPSARTSSGWRAPSSGSARGRSRSSATARFARSSRAGRGSSSPGTSRTTRSRERLAAARVVCGPSLVEPFGQALLEALAAGRPVVATQRRRAARVRPAEGGACSSTRSTRTRSSTGLRRAAALPCPNDAGDRGRRASTTCGRQAERIEAILERAAGAALSRSASLGGGARRRRSPPEPLPSAPPTSLRIASKSPRRFVLPLTTTV